MQFRKTVGEFLSSDNQHKIRYYVYTPLTGEPRAVLQISHGMCEFIERYEPFAEYLCKNGIAVAGNDHLGHGVMAQEAGTLGWFAEKDGYRLLPADLRKLTILMQRQFLGKPYFLLGHSMGSFVARLYLAKYSELLTGAIIMGTSGPNPLAKFGIIAANHIIKKRGTRYHSEFLKNASTGNYSKRFAAENDKNSWLSKDVEIRNQYAGSPLCSFDFTAGGHRDMFTLLGTVSTKEWAARIPKALPVLLTSGHDDPVGQYGKGVEQVYALLQAAGMTDVTLKLYDNDRHEILNELDREQVYGDILHYIEEKAKLR